MALSIIIPCHNSASTIVEAVESVLRQTCKDWELIIVNDGSSDNTLQIIEEYEARDKRIRVLNFKENKGVAAARNVGIEMSRFNYIGFLDSDDTLERNFVGKMLLTANNHDCDVVWCQYKIISSNFSKGNEIENKLHEDRLMDNKTVLKSFFDSTPGVAAIWNKIYSREFIEREVPTRFNTIRRRAEDWEFNLMLFQKEGKCVAISDTLYNYRQLGGVSSMCQFVDKDFYLIFRSIDLLAECNDKNQLGFDKDVIIKNSSVDIFEHLYNSVKTAPYMIYREKINDIRFKNLIEKFDCSILPLSYKIPAILIKAKLPKTAFLLSKFLTKL